MLVQSVQIVLHPRFFPFQKPGHRLRKRRVRQPVGAVGGGGQQLSSGGVSGVRPTRAEGGAVAAAAHCCSASAVAHAPAPPADAIVRVCCRHTPTLTRLLRVLDPDQSKEPDDDTADDAHDDTADDAPDDTLDDRPDEPDARSHNAPDTPAVATPLSSLS